jgi:predicted O-linked N-acetylglucosamine transferase (SPINDLY family)
MEALGLHQQGQLQEALAGYQEVLQAVPNQFDALHLSGVIAAQGKDFLKAIVLISRALAVFPASAEAHNNRGVAHKDLHRYAEALKDFEAAVALSPDYIDALNNRGVAQLALRRLDDALKSFDVVIQRQPTYANAHFNKGCALSEAGRYTEALLCLNQAITLNPSFAAAYDSRGVVLHQLNQYEAALASYQQCLQLQPSSVRALIHLGIAYNSLDMFAEGLKSFDQAIALAPYDADAHYNRGNLLRRAKGYPQALDAYERALALKASFANLPGLAQLIRMQLSSWDNYRQHLEQLTMGTRAGQAMAGPFPTVAMLDDLALQKQAAQRWVVDKCPSNAQLGDFTRKPSTNATQKIRIGYFSADFYNHATAYLMAELFERHDKTRFELIGFSFGPDQQDEMRKRLLSAFDQFVDVRQMSDLDVARLARSMDIDIAVDLKGFTHDARTGIFAARAAPVQVNYLGYPGTMAAPYMDYIIADKTLIPQESQIHYSEKIVYMPGSYQVNDSHRAIAQQPGSRVEVGLPETGVVFAPSIIRTKSPRLCSMYGCNYCEKLKAASCGC